MNPPKKICILGLPDFIKNYQNAFVPDAFQTILPLSQSSTFDLLNDPFTIHATVQISDLLILPGGGDIDPAFFHEKNIASRNIDFMLDRIQLEFLEAFVNAGKPVIGICKGMQLINIFFGGGLNQNMPPSSLALHAYHEKDSYHDIYKAPAPYSDGNFHPNVPLSSLSRDLFVNSAHHQSVSRLGNNLCALHHAGDGVVETLYHSSLPILGLQWHPERLYIHGKNQLTPLASELLFV